jgi:phosphatidylserine decarboxylase
MQLHKEGYRIIAWSFLVILIINYYLYTKVDIFWIKSILSIGSLIAFMLIVYFFRFPKRHVEAAPNEVVAPVDGKVVVIEEVFEPEFFKDKRLQMSIFMSPLNVHATRYPVSGKVIYSKYYKGKHLVAWHPKSSELNERTTIVVDNPVIGPVMFRQIAGAVARRIENYSKVGDVVKQGDDAGFIKFGSRVDVFLPLNTNPEVVIGDKTRGGETIIAEVLVDLAQKTTHQS